MPKLNSDIDDMSDVDEIPSNGIPAHKESAVEADVEAKDQLQEDLADDVGNAKGPEAKEEELNRVTDDEGEEEGDNDEEYEVEAIRGHEWRRPRNKKTGPKYLRYNVKWKGWPESANTLEPEENLSAARDILAAYHHKIGGAPQPESESELKKKRPMKSLGEDSNVNSTAEDSPAPSVKRQKRMTSGLDDPLVKEDTDAEWGAWLPKGKTWETEIKEIQTVERDPKTQDLYILIVFKNGKKSKVKREVVHKRCPLKMLEFYENHLSV